MAAALIGSKTVGILRQAGHEVIAASPNTGVNTITGEGLKEAIAGAQVVIDLTNSPSLEDRVALEFFQTSGRNLLAAEAAAWVRHHICLSIVGTDGAAPGSRNNHSGRQGFPRLHVLAVEVGFGYRPRCVLYTDGCD